MKPPIMMNVQSVRVRKLARFLTCSFSSAVSCFSGGFSMSFRRGGAGAGFSDGTKLACAGGFDSAAGAGVGTWRIGGEGATGVGAEGPIGGVLGAEPFTFGSDGAAPFTGFGATTFASTTDTGSGVLSSSSEASSASTITGDVATGGVESSDRAGVSDGEGSAGCCTSLLAALCALAAARAAFSSWRFSARANAFCFLSALLDGFVADSEALWSPHVSTNTTEGTE